MAWSCDASWAAADDTSLSEARKGVGHHVSGPVNVALVHGAWADGSCWSGVIERLQAGGFQVQEATDLIEEAAVRVGRGAGV
jgi:hypothetical protein